MRSIDTDAQFVYNENGLRIQKTVNGVVTKYTLHGKNIVHMTQGGNELHFFYDAQNRPAVVVYNGTAYAYVKSLQGDIVAILDEDGNTATQELGTSICNLTLKDHTRPAFLTTDGYLVALCSDVVLKDFVPCAEEKISHVLVFDLLADTIQLVDDFTSQN